MNTMQAGANIAVNQSGSIDILISWLPFDISIDVAAFALNNSDKVRFDSDFIYLNGEIDTQGDFISLSLNAGKSVFRVDLNKTPSDINKIVFAVASPNSLSTIQNLNIEVKDLSVFTPENTGLQSLILGELYFKNQQWKFRALGQGYQQGLEFLAVQFGTQFNRQAQRISLPDVVNNNTTNDNANPVFDTIKEELPDLREAFKPDNIRSGIRSLKSFSWGWMLSSLVVFIIAEIAITGLFQTNLFWSFIPISFRYLVEVVSFSLSFLIGGVVVGLISPSIRVLEPAIAAFLSVIILLSNGFFTPHGFNDFSFIKMLIGGSIAFALAMYGARLGEKIAAMLGNKTSKDYVNNR
ncbi:General stress protein 16U [Candidatus Brocadiaceae bacterium]|nr:General stress protein 16U [Candidatus Brocadiaceae bacterium]